MIFTFFGFLLFAWQTDSNQAIVGKWYTENDDALVEIFRCGDSWCGRIVDIREKTYPEDDAQGMGGQSKIDRLNPDKSLRQRPIIGLLIMEGFRQDGDLWRGGTIYDPDKGKTYRCKMRLVKEGRQLYVRGFVGVSLLGRTTHWRRAD